MTPSPESCSSISKQLGAVSGTGPSEVVDGFLREIAVAAMAAPWTVDCDIVVVVSGFADVAQHLETLAMLARSSLTLVAGSELATESRIVLSDTTGVMEPSGLAWQLRVVDDIDLTMVDELLSDAQAKPAESDEHEVEVTVPAPAPAPEQVSPSPQILAVIEKIMAPCGVEVKVLRSTPVVEGVKLTAKPTAVTAYIALHPGVSAKTVKSVFWGEDKTRAAENAFTKIRNLLGDTPEGERRFVKGAEFTFCDVGSDWQRFNALVETANSTELVVDQAAALDVALGLIGGEPAKDVQGVLWAWFTDDRRWYETVDALIVDAASMRAKLALEADDPVGARCALRSGQSGMPSSEALKGLSFIATKALDGDKNLDAEYLEALADAEACGYDLTPGTHALYNALRSQPDLRVVSGLGGEPVPSVGS